MSKLVKEAVELLNNLTDEELMGKYGNMLLRPFPPMVEVQALHKVMLKRGISSPTIAVTLVYQDSNGFPKSLQLTSL